MKVPELNQQTTPINPISGITVPVNAPIEAFGGGAAAAGVQSATQTVEHETRNFALQQEDHANSVAITNATTQTVQKKNDLLYNPKSGLITKKGANAFGADEQINSEYESFRDDIVNSLSNQKQKDAYLNNANQLGMSLNEAVQKHVFVETKNYDDQVSQSSIQAAQQDAVDNFQVPGVVEQRLQDQKGLILKNATRNGLPLTETQTDADGNVTPSITGMMIKNAQSSTISKVVDKMLANQMDTAAQKFYDSYKNSGMLTAEDSTRLDKNLEEGSLRGQSQRLTDQYTAPKLNNGGQPIPGTQPSMQDAIAKATEVTKDDPKLRDATVSRIKDFYSTQKAAQSQDAEDALKNAYSTIDQTKELPDPATFNKLDPSGKNSVRSYLSSVRKGIEPETNWGKYYELHTLASDPATRNDFAKKNLMEYRNDLDNSKFTELVHLQDGVRNQSAKANSTLDGYRIDTQIVNDSLGSAGYNTKAKPGTSAFKDIALFHSKVDDQMALLEQRTGKKPTNKDVQEITDRLLVSTITQRGYLWNSTTPAFKLQSGQSADVDMQDIPKAEVLKIKDALQRNGRPTTDAAIIDTFKRKISQ